MEANYPIDEVPATTEYVLEVLQDDLRIAGEPLKLTFETPFWAWEDALMVESWGRGGFAGAMNFEWGINIPVEEFHRFSRVKDRTVGGLCRLIAAHAKKPVIRAWKHLGRDCLPAGAFLTVRTMLIEAGEDAEKITPSTLLHPYLRYSWDKIWKRFSRLAPGIGPVPTHSVMMRRIIRSGVVLGLLTLLVGALMGFEGLLLAAGVLVLASLAVISGATEFWQFPDPNIRTFRDLAYALAGQQPRRRIQPTP